MKKITSLEELKESIFLLERKQATESALLKEQINLTIENFKPVNLIKNTLTQLANAHDFKGDLMNATIGLAAGYLSKKAAVGNTHNPIKQLLGTILQLGVTSIVSKNADGIKSIGMSLLNSIFRKKENESNL